MDWAVTENRNSISATPDLKVPSAAWQPDWRASLPLAVAAALLVLSGLVFLPYRWWAASPHPQRVSILLHPVLPRSRATPAVPKTPPRRVHAHRPSAAEPPRVTIEPPVKPVEPPAIDWQQQIDSAAAAQAGVQSPVQFNAPPVKPLDRHLEKALNAPHHVASMQSGDSYRAAAGRTIIKSGNRCGSVETLQMSSSPTNKATVGSLTACPGDDQPTMGDELNAWADKRAKAQPPP